MEEEEEEEMEGEEEEEMEEEEEEQKEQEPTACRGGREGAACWGRGEGMSGDEDEGVGVLLPCHVTDPREA
jgi:hypothetical protein